MPLGYSHLGSASRLSFDRRLSVSARKTCCRPTCRWQRNRYQEQILRLEASQARVHGPKDCLDLRQLVRWVSTPRKVLRFILTIMISAIPNGVVNSFSTIIIRDMGFTTTKTTQLQSIGNAVQVIGLLISGVIILSIPNCEHQNYPTSSQHVTDHIEARLITATAANILCTIAAACMA
jgi:hypothetical protein